MPCSPRSASSAAAPSELAGATLSPAAARWEPGLGEYILDDADLRDATDPVEFARSAFRHACAACEWDAGLVATIDGTPPPIS